MKVPYSLLQSIVVVAFLLGCRESLSQRGTMLHFDLGNREVKYVNKELEEISGIVFLGNGQGMAAINDEKGRIYFLDFDGRSHTTSIKFGKSGDYEDITADDKYFYVLHSKGRIFRVPRDRADQPVRDFALGKKKSEFESLYYDSSKGKLVMLCKNCAEGKKRNRVPAYCFDPKSLTFDSEPCFYIDMNRVRHLLKDDDLVCKPSAAAIHPILNKLFVLCSVGKALLICSLDGQVEEAFRLDPDFFPQPEGITFSSNGDAYISNEGHRSPGTIVRFPFIRQ